MRFVVGLLTLCSGCSLLLDSGNGIGEFDEPRQPVVVGIGESSDEDLSGSEMQWPHSVADDAPIALLVFAGVRGSHASIELLVDEVPVPGPDCAVGTSGADGIEISTYGWLVVIPESPGATTLPMELSLNEDVDALVGFAQNLEPSILEIASFDENGGDQDNPYSLGLATEAGDLVVAAFTWGDASEVNFEQVPNVQPEDLQLLATVVGDPGVPSNGAQMGVFARQAADEDRTAVQPVFEGGQPMPSWASCGLAVRANDLGIEPEPGL